MRKFGVYCLYDSLGKQYGSLGIMVNDESAQAYVGAQVKEAGTIRVKELCKIGEFDLDTGVVTPCDIVRLPFTPDVLMPVHNADVDNKQA